ncbi:radical SAM protein [Motiliproteus sp. SC1-56]|uniref:radical SAM protein n=1 Tax=Motiliproteus sp. SC1-56 TaxID=2799565 RepID=UPI001F5D0506|nr:radical SAM protein [Motiliproteus sp. SC1-56]
MQYIEPLYRPPSEAKSLILQITNGCSYNKCTFCHMYRDPQKKFRVKPEAEVRNEIALAARYQPDRIFLADGDAMTLSFRRLQAVLQAIKEQMPNVRRVSAYCLPRNLKNKTIEELAELKKLGLELVYVGVESGDDEVLRRVRKGEDYRSTLDALAKLKGAGIKVSAMVLTGLGGKQFSKQHAINSARLVSEAQPEYLSTLVLMLPQGDALVQEDYDGQFEPLSQRALLEENLLFLEHLELNKTIFRSDHASNYLVLKGVLGKDKERMIGQVKQALCGEGSVQLRPEWARGL